MANSYQRFLKNNIDLAPLGVERRAGEVTYFCTPRGATIFGWAGVDGIHYCFIRGFGEMVFAVSPENDAPNYVHPLAKNFKDFLRLLLACGSAGALEQAWIWNQAEFDAFLWENQPAEEQKAVLAEIADQLRLTPMENPWQYIRELQSSFDDRQIKYTEDFYDPDMNPNAGRKALEREKTEWKVYFDGNFWGHRGRDRAGKEIPVGKHFEWAGRHWLIPALYACSKGLVIEFCMQIDPGQIRAFMDKWDLNAQNEADKNFSREQQMEIERDNPLCLDFDAVVRLNGKELVPTYGYGVSYNPCLPRDMIRRTEAKKVVDHYGLDPAYGWVIRRSAFPWKTKRRTEIRNLSVTLSQCPVSVPGPHFRVAAPGDTFDFTFPETGSRHTLTVQEYEQQKMDFSRMPAQDMEYPPYYFGMSYTIMPPLPNDRLTVSDCMDSDPPRQKHSKQEDPLAPVAKNSSIGVIGIIGGADGPTAIVVGDAGPSRLQAACSALHFEPVKEVEWHMIFHEKQFDDLTIGLMGHKDGV